MKVLGILLLLINLNGLAQTADQSAIGNIRKHPGDTSLINTYLNSLQKDADPSDSWIQKGEELYRILKPTKHHKQVGILGIVMASKFNSKGNYSQALHYIMIAEKRLKQMPPSNLLSTAYNIMGNTYLGLNNPAKQKESFEKCYQTGLKLHDHNAQATGAMGLGNYYGSISDFEQSNHWNKKALIQFDSLQNYLAGAILRVNMAGTYRQLNNYKTAARLLSEAQKLLPLADHNYVNLLYYSEESAQRMELKQYHEAILSYQTALDYALAEKANHNISEIYLALSEAYKKNRQYEESLGALTKHLQYKDSVFNEDGNRQILALEEHYKSEKKDAEIQLLSKTNALNESELERRNMLIWTFGVAGILFIGIGFALWKSNRRKNKSNQLLAAQNKIIEQKQEEIVSSINYAKRIQYTLLASDSLLNSQLKKHFVLFQPKDIVSGDFYWAIKSPTHFFLAVCDCTGHGVPGAFMSLLNINFLKEAITEKQLAEPGAILDFVRQRLIENLEHGKHFDGMDGILISMNLETKKISYAGANNGPVIIRQEEVIELPYDKMPVGNGIKTNPFQTHHLPYETGDWLYLFTDGYADQFGGIKGKKFKYRQLKELLLKTSKKPEKEQHDLLKEAFNSWKSDLEQVDDICVFGIGL